MFPTAISVRLQKNLALLGKTGWLAPFYLAGGSAASLQLGHRFSFDLDFFTPEKFDPKTISQNLKFLGELSIDQEDKGTFLGNLNGVKISFFPYPYPLVFSPKKYLGVKVADLQDIACMKIDSISTRSARRDFIDLYFICQKYPLKRLFKIFKKKYRGVNYNLFHLIKSLTYFPDAEGEEMPQMITPVTWEKVKDFFVVEVKKISEELLK